MSRISRMLSCLGVRRFLAYFLPLMTLSSPLDVVQGLLGYGSFGTVVAAEDSMTGQAVAVKLLHKGVQQDVKREERVYDILVGGCSPNFRCVLWVVDAANADVTLACSLKSLVAGITASFIALCSSAVTYRCTMCSVAMGVSSCYLVDMLRRLVSSFSVVLHVCSSTTCVRGHCS